MVSSTSSRQRVHLKTDSIVQTLKTDQNQEEKSKTSWYIPKRMRGKGSIAFQDHTAPGRKGRHMKNFAWMMGVLLAFPATGLAAQGAADMPFMESIRMMAIVAFLGIVLICGTVLLGKRLKFFPTIRSGIIHVLDSRGIAPRKFLCLVEVHGKELLLGVGDRIELLASWSAPDADAVREFEAALHQVPREPAATPPHPPEKEKASSPC